MNIHMPGPMQFLHESTPQVITGSLARYLRKRNPTLTAERARDIALAAVMGALADGKPQAPKGTP